ncbi:MAG: hypothetical protein VX436_02820 [Planctomycetota bacterium]|nr:hypothetical protein [Planctomycetota bacterium]
MKQVIFPTILSTVFAVPSTTLGDYIGLGMEQVQFDEQPGDLYTVRLYAEFTQATDQLNAVFGDSSSDLYIRSTNGFYQNTFGGPTTQSINPNFFPIFPSLEYDSWITIGSENQVGNEMIDIGFDWNEFESGGDIETNNGSWFATPEDMQVVAGSDLRVLIGQFTTYGWDSNVYGSINLQGKIGDFETFQARDQYFSAMLPPTPGSIALIGIAGLCTRRRR